MRNGAKPTLTGAIVLIMLMVGNGGLIPMVLGCGIMKARQVSSFSIIVYPVSDRRSICRLLDSVACVVSVFGEKAALVSVFERRYAKPFK